MSFDGLVNKSWVREFYCNFHAIAIDDSSFHTFVRRNYYTFHADFIAQYLHIDRPALYDYPSDRRVVANPIDFNDVVHSLLSFLSRPRIYILRLQL